MSREFNDATKAELERICARYPKREAALLPALRLLEREFGCVDEEGMIHAAKLLGVSPAKVFGVFTFYTHYRRPTDRKYVIEHCSTVPCALRGSEKVHDHLKGVIRPDDPITLKKVECLASCDTAPCLQVNGDFVDFVTPEMCDEMVAGMRAGTWKAPTPVYKVPATKYPPVLLKHVLERGSETLDHYLKRGGYQTFQDLVKTQRKPEEIVEEVFKSGLRGRGGAGFPTGQKWKFLAKNDKPRYLVVNADESEPGTFKDKMLIDRDPHAILEGILISGYAINAKCAYIYIRGEFANGSRALDKALAEAEQAGLTNGFPITVHRGAGAYICGEETGLLSSLEGNRGYPKIKPPFPAVEGLFRCPTIVNNVETLATVTHIVKNGTDWFRKMGTEKSPGMKIFSVCGHVERPGNYEIPLAVPLKELIFDLAGGVRGGKKLKAVIPGGLSAPVLTAAEVMADPPLRMDFDSLAAAKTMLGSGGVIVIDEDTCMVDALWNTLRFYHHESCGQCTPCREGTGWIEKLAGKMERGRGRMEEIPKLDEIAWGMCGRTICVLADAAALPTRSFVQKFKPEFEAHVNAKSCPYKHGSVKELAHA
ncbi:MAG TPA: NADH-quinone oxidoreductase subunit NuoF [Planctomycetota bacterium]|nr:NADH-quinone oxidoreductase subunit NuoF [Planctomycetota bacterium]